MVGLLRISIRLLRREDVAPQVLTSLRILMMMKPNVVHAISRQVGHQSTTFRCFKILLVSKMCLDGLPQAYFGNSPSTPTPNYPQKGVRIFEHSLTMMVPQL